jgi:hypothetical protein
VFHADGMPREDEQKTAQEPDKQQPARQDGPRIPGALRSEIGEGRGKLQGPLAPGYCAGGAPVEPGRVLPV